MKENIRIARQLVRLAQELVDEGERDKAKAGGCDGVRAGGAVMEKTVVLDVPYDKGAALSEGIDDEDGLFLADDEGAAGTAVQEPAAAEPKKIVFSFGDLLDIAFGKMCSNMKKAYARQTPPEDRGRGLVYTLTGTAIGVSGGNVMKKISENGDIGEVVASAELSNSGRVPSIKLHLRFFGSFNQGRRKENENAQTEFDYVFPVAIRNGEGTPILGKDGKWYVSTGYRRDDIVKRVSEYLTAWLAVSKAGILSQVAEKVVNPNA